MTISIWEKTKRIVANLFEIETKGQIAERIERLKWEEQQKVLKLEQAQRLRAYKIENADKIEQFNKDREERINRAKLEEENRKIQEEERRKRQEAIELYKTNHWYKAFTDKPKEDNVVEDIVE